MTAIEWLKANVSFEVDPVKGSTYITPDGKFVNLRAIGFEHIDLANELENYGIISEEDEVVPGLQSNGWIRCKEGVSGYSYLEVREVQPTADQYEAIEKWIDFVLSHRKKVSVVYMTYSIYDEVEYGQTVTGSDVVKSIKRAYQTDALIPASAFENSTTQVKRAIYGDPTGKIRTFALITAANPMSQQMPAGVNNRLIKEFKQGIKIDPENIEESLRSGHFQYIPVLGRYEMKDEKSFMVLNIPLEAAENLAYGWKQKSFIFGEVKEDRALVSYYATDDYSSPESYTLRGESEGVDLLSPSALDNFTQKNGFKFSFRFPAEAFEGNLIPCNNAEAFEAQMEGGRSSKSRAEKRKAAYSSKSIPELKITWKVTDDGYGTRIEGYYSDIDGGYVDPDMVDFYKKHGIIPQLAQKGHGTCSIGFSEKEQKWYGWSHRAIAGFEIGHKCKKGDAGVALKSEKAQAPVWYPEPGFKCKTLEDCKNVAIAFADSVD